MIGWGRGRGGGLCWAPRVRVPLPSHGGVRGGGRSPPPPPPTNLEKRGKKKRKILFISHHYIKCINLPRPQRAPRCPPSPPHPTSLPGGRWKPPRLSAGGGGEGALPVLGFTPPKPGGDVPKIHPRDVPKVGDHPQKPLTRWGGGDKNLGSPPVSRDIASGARGKGQKMEITDLGWVTLGGSGEPLSPRVSQVGEVTSTPGVACDEEGTGGHAWAQGRGTKG